MASISYSQETTEYNKLWKYRRKKKLFKILEILSIATDQIVAVKTSWNVLFDSTKSEHLQAVSCTSIHNAFETEPSKFDKHKSTQLAQYVRATQSNCSYACSLRIVQSLKFSKFNWFDSLNTKTFLKSYWWIKFGLKMYSELSVWFFLLLKSTHTKNAILTRCKHAHTHTPEWRKFTKI